MKQFTELKDGVIAFYAKDRKTWRRWLVSFHESEKKVWLIIYKKDSGTPGVTYKEAVEEALCFGWIDSKPNKRDTDSYYQYFSQRKPKSIWSAINKVSVEKLIAAGLMQPAGMAMIDLAKKTGTWDSLNAVDALSYPPAFKNALAKNKTANKNFEAFPVSIKKGILYWILSAKTIATRDKRIAETINKAAENIRANQYISKT